MCPSYPAQCVYVRLLLAQVVMQRWLVGTPLLHQTNYTMLLSAHQEPSKLHDQYLQQMPVVSPAASTTHS